MSNADNGTPIIDLDPQDADEGIPDSSHIPQAAGGVIPYETVSPTTSSGLTGTTSNPYNNQDVNGLLSGFAWNPTNHNLTYSFPTASTNYGATYTDQNALTGWQALSSLQQTVVTYALGLVSQYTLLTFTQITESSTTHAAIRVSGSSYPSTSYTYYPGIFDSSGDVWIGGTRNMNPTGGSYAFDTLLHELGHSLGLKHGQEDLTNQGFGVLPTAHNSTEYSVMDYYSYPGGPLAFTNAAGSGNLTYMVDDISALQYLYGANYTTNSGNTVYTWSPTTGVESINGVAQTMSSSANKIYESLWDGGGIDTYDLSNYTTAVSINLLPGQWSTFSTPQLANLGSGNLAPGNIDNANLYKGNIASLIENAIGGSKNDIIIGNVANNNLQGGAGDDTITGGAGNDTIDGGPGSDTAVYSGASTQYLITRLSPTSYQISDLRPGAPDGSDTLSNVEFAQFTDQTVSLTANTPPVVTTANLSEPHLHTLALSSLFSVSDADSDTITQYQIQDNTIDLNSGHFTVNGVTQLPVIPIIITAAQLAQTSFVTGAVGDSLQISAFDGTAWSTVSSFTISVPPNNLPVVTTANLSKSRNQTLALSSLFSVSDADGDAITQYQIQDNSLNLNSGYFTIGGIPQLPLIPITISAAQLAQTNFVTGTAGDSLQISAFDGISWGAASSFTVSVADNPPVVTTANVSEVHNQTLALSSLFSVSDADGDTITQYQIQDNTTDPDSGHFVINGVAQAAGSLITITASQLAQTSFVTGTAGDSLQISAFDGIAWSAAPSSFTVSILPNNAPVVTTANVSEAHNQTLALSSLFSVSDADGDAITQYQIQDSTSDPNSGYFVINGVAQASGTPITITASQLAQTSFVTGTAGDNLQISAFDGIAWSAAPSSFTVSVLPNNPPVVTTADVTEPQNQTLALSGLFSVSDADGDAITSYQLLDASPNPASGHFVVGGVVQAAGAPITITASQLAQTSFVTGTIGANLQIRASDGIDWSAADNVPWSPFALNMDYGDGVTSQTTVSTDGTASVALTDTTGLRPWATQVTQYDASGNVGSQTIVKPSGVTWVNGYDTAGTQSWQWETTSSDPLGNTLQQSGTNDDGTHWLTLYDPSNQYDWTNATIAFDAGWNQTGLSGTNDDSSPITSMNSVIAGLDTTLWFAAPYDPNFGSLLAAH